MDTKLFDAYNHAYNHCDPTTLGTMVSDDLEFSHYLNQAENRLSLKANFAH